MTVALDLNSVFEDAQAHVMLSRAQRLEQVCILRNLDDSKIRTSNIGLEELRRLERISINKNPTPWNKQTESTIKIASLNCAGLGAHFIDIEADEKLLEADIIHLSETSLEEQQGHQLSLPGYKQHLVNIGNGKGIATYFKEDVFSHQQDIRKLEMQVTKFASKEIDVIGVYRSNKGNSQDLLHHLEAMITIGKPTLISGDFNICFLNHSGNRMSRGLEKIGFSQLVREATHVKGGHIDHVYWNDDHKVWRDPQLELYCPYYSDHDATLTTLRKQDCKTSTSRK